MYDERERDEAAMQAGKLWWMTDARRINIDRDQPLTVTPICQPPVSRHSLVPSHVYRLCAVLLQHLPSALGLLELFPLLGLVITLAKPKRVGAALEGDAMEWLGESVGYLFLRWDVV